MKICFLSDGIAEHTRRWVKFFAHQGHQVDLITFNPDVLDDYKPVNLHIVEKPVSYNSIFSQMINFPFVLKRVKKIINKLNPDIIHAHSATSYAWITMSSGFHPYIVTPWGSDVLVEMKNSIWNRFITTITLNNADLITTDASHVKDKMIGYGIESEKINILMFGFDFNRLNIESAAWMDEQREIYNLGNSSLVISARTLNPIHDVKTFIKAIPIIDKMVSNVKYICLTDGSDRKMLEELTESLGLVNKVIFPGYVAEDDMIRWLMISDVYVSTSLSDAGLSSSTAEAMACELPVVSTTENSDNHIWIDEEKGGFLTKNGDYNAIANGVIQLLKDDDMRYSFGKFNKQVIYEKYNYDKEMKKMEIFYTKLSSNSI